MTQFTDAAATPAKAAVSTRDGRLRDQVVPPAAAAPAVMVWLARAKDESRGSFTLGGAYALFGRAAAAAEAAEAALGVVLIGRNWPRLLRGCCCCCVRAGGVSLW